MSFNVTFSNESSIFRQLLSQCNNFHSVCRETALISSVDSQTGELNIENNKLYFFFMTHQFHYQG